MIEGRLDDSLLQLLSTGMDHDTSRPTMRPGAFKIVCRIHRHAAHEGGEVRVRGALGIEPRSLGNVADSWGLKA